MKLILSLLICISVSTAHAGLVDDAESPVNTDAKWILLTGTGLTLIAVGAESSLTQKWETWTATNRPLGKSSKYGDAMGQLVPNAVYAGGELVASYFGADKGLGRAWLMVEATAYASLLSTVLKYNVSEGRPYNSQTGSSFPSGHSTSAFAFAGVVAAEHGWVYGVPAMALATFVAYSRINDNQHRIHDVIAGGTIGLTCAYGLYYAHHAENKNSVQILPAPIEGGAEVLAAWNY